MATTTNVKTSILLSTKKLLGIEPDYDHFDDELIIHINSVFFTLLQLGIGPEDGFMIEDEEAEWFDFIEDRKDLNAVKTYVYLRVRLLFDPPQMGYLVDAIKKQAEELEWRLNAQIETFKPKPKPPDPPLPPITDDTEIDDHTLQIIDNVMLVHTAEEIELDSTLPVTSEKVYNLVGDLSKVLK